jgi:peptidoglycan/LPS O-acetylase OafA/YrhL
MRGVAILGVVATHVGGKFPSGNEHVDFVLGMGRFGVQLFFFVSALTMCLMWQRRNEEKHQTRNFYIRRVCRIAPLFWLAIPVYYGPSLSSLQILLTATFLHGLSPSTINLVVPGGWSIAVEMMFYVAFPLIVTRVKPKAEDYLAIGFLAYLGNALVISPALFALFSPYFLAGTVMRDFLYMNFFHQLPIFLLGCAIYFGRAALPNKPSAAILAVWLLVSVSRRLLHIDAPMENMTLVTLALYPAVILMQQIQSTSLPSRLLGMLGKNSYSIYISHFLVIALLARAFDTQGWAKVGFLPDVGGLLATVAATCLIAKPLHFAVERPGHRVAEYLVNASERSGRFRADQPLPAQPS